MVGLVPAIHVFFGGEARDVDARHKAGHDEFHYRACFMVCILTRNSLET